MLAQLINRIKEKPPTILVLGDLMLDRFIFGSVDRISPEAPVPIVKLKKEEQMLGGSGNVIRNLSNLGIQTSLCSVVGKDLAGDLLINQLIEKDIQISNVHRLNSVRTTEKMRIVADRQQIVRVDWDMDQFKADFVDDLIKNISGHIENIDGVIISDYAKGMCSEVLLKKVIEISNNNNIPIFIDPKGIDWGKYKHTNLITPNIKEAETVLGKKLTNDQDFEKAGEKICSTYNIEACLITRGGDGMSFFCKNNTFHLKSNAKEIFDVSGAGDTVISTMATGLVMNLTYKQAAEFSNRAAGIVVGHIGTSAITTRELLNLN
jgi:D-beta-D-heptose 7-phosphate kinase/D-beta-D-heptose 1-phosphate adenosyltransferase